MIFDDIDNNKMMISGAYKKLKSYYYYNKNFIFMKQKISMFEYNDEAMNRIIDKLATILSDIESYSNQETINEWINVISFYIMPKTFVDKHEKNPLFVTGIQNENKPISKVNFFIDMGIELHLLETLWTVLMGKIIYDKKIITEDCYGNCIDNAILYNKQEDYLKSINFTKNKLFKIYFWQYSNWKNNSINAVKKAYNEKKSTMLFTLDIKGFYYSVNWRFQILDQLCQDDEHYIEIKPLTKVLEKIYCRYTQLLKSYREIYQNEERGEYILPIGMFSSMLLANVYLSPFDQRVKSNKNVIYYGRYVDDILLLLDVSNDASSITESTFFEKCLTETNLILEKGTKGKYNIYKYPNLVIQKEKVKTIYFESGRAGALIRQLEKTISYPSQMNIIPDINTKLPDFEAAVYAIKNFTNKTKIRDIEQIEVDRFQLGWHMSQIVYNSINKKNLSKNDKIERQNESDKILDFFQGSRALEYSSNWTNALYFFLLIEGDGRRVWKMFEGNVRNAINKLKVEQLEDIRQGKSRNVKSRMKKCLQVHFDICVATALALNPTFSRREKDNIIDIAIKLRQANLFNHYLVSFPLINYSDNIDTHIDLTNITPEQMHVMNLKIVNSNKSVWSPRFINLNEIFEYFFLKQVTKGGNYFLDIGNNSEDTLNSAKKKIDFIEDFFYTVNRIKTKKHLSISIRNERKFENYIIQRIKLENGRNNENIRIAIANIKLDTKRCCFGLKGYEQIDLHKDDFFNILKETYIDKNNKVHFLLFPEFYLPVQWIADVLNFVRKTGITVVSGIQYITNGDRAFNNVSIFAPIITGKYRNSVMLVREKNDYAPMEQKILAIEQYKCENQLFPSYQIISSNGLDYGVFLCYEFTDIVARSLYKNEIDILFTPEHNKDTSYFSNIIESTTRDLHAFIVQANTSIYGDSRITGPYSKNDRNIVQIKGGDSDNIIIGTIAMDKIRKYQIEEEKKAENTINKYLSMSYDKRVEEKKKIFEEKDLSISKTSARFNVSRLDRG